MTDRFLYEKYKFLDEDGHLGEESPKIITKNLNPNLPIRLYQDQAFRTFTYHYNKHCKKGQQTHLLFNMATGSGKTLVMAGLILYLYEHGYRNFLFFVNSDNVIKKTKDNFLNALSSKYLFNKQLNFDGRNIHISEVKNFEYTNENDINICFTTIQKLHSDLHIEKENSITIEDFKGEKIVLLSDEAHHVQVKTKQLDLDMTPSWENTVENIFIQNSHNLLLEFTATMDFADVGIKKKYLDKVIYRYDLKEFRNDGYSKDINIFQSDSNNRERMLQAIILNQYRQQVANKYKIDLKPVILFKAQKTIEQSKLNQAEFDKLIDTLEKTDIEKIKQRSHTNILIKAFKFFNDHDISDTLLVEILKKNFTPSKCINVNREEDIRDFQLLLNSLEDKDNKKRAIFAVQKLNEGWDVLNLFDIVRLYDTRDSGYGKIGKTTLSEAQLIGRGARYFPFQQNEKQRKYQRKFDSDADNELRIIEQLHYHSKEDSKYISELKQALRKEGIYDQEKDLFALSLKEDFKKQKIYKEGLIYLNRQITNKNEGVHSLSDLRVSKKNITYMIASDISEVNAVFREDDYNLKPDQKTTVKDIPLKEIPKHVIRHAIDRNNFYTFENLIQKFPYIKSMSEFITNSEYLAGLAITFQGASDDLKKIANKQYLGALIVLLQKLESEIQANSTEHKGTKEFEPHAIKNIFGDKILKIHPTDPRADGQWNLISQAEWYAYNANHGTSEEKEFVKMMEGQIGKFQEQGYKDIYILRNEEHFKIYSIGDGRGFMPDFVMFMNDKNKQILTYQFYIEVKGEHLQEYDKWKQDFLLEIQELHKDKIEVFNENKHYKILGLPFYNSEYENGFKEALHESVALL